MGAEQGRLDDLHRLRRLQRRHLGRIPVERRDGDPLGELPSARPAGCRTHSVGRDGLTAAGPIGIPGSNMVFRDQPLTEESIAQIRPPVGVELPRRV